ncbi:serine O-acetyltransferase [Urechidicola croceus]|uniref:Serine acetyltransferase n=1 Tax=Urechidicola croceus TaxID=1850246 RepID=A0A1D8PAK7_9FLAO|nr:serine acetyltransferase [Urechidicola croceus]AOW21597.1 serine acetyltransferase [Urechidicola croceus]
MTKDSIIEKIISNRNTPRLDFSIKYKTEEFTNNLFHTLFDAKSCVETNIDKLESQFREIYDLACFDNERPCKDVWNKFLTQLPTLLEKLNLDANACLNFDPASNSIEEVYIAYPGFFAIAIHRFSHELNKICIPLIPRLMSEYAHRLTGVDIHPGATIGDSFFIDHATGIVIGETCIIKENVKIYQGVTLGALQVKKSLKNIKRHPTVEANVIIYANATILGGDTTIGANSIIGGNVWITESVPENSFVYHKPETQMKTKR